MSQRKVEVSCTNPHEIRLSVTAEMTIGEWREVLKRVNGSEPHYYAPLQELLLSIERGINAIADREAVEWVEVKPLEPVANSRCTCGHVSAYHRDPWMGQSACSVRVNDGYVESSCPCKKFTLDVANPLA